MMGFPIKEALRCICFNHGWSYAVSWRAKCRDSMLLMPEDVYCEEHVGMVVEKVVHQVHVVGEGMIGQAAITGRHQWIFSDTYCGESCPTGSFNSLAMPKDTAEWRLQFLAGIKTVAIISVSQQSVIQFGSTQKMLERLEFVNHVRSLFQQLHGALGPYLLRNSLKAIKTETTETYNSLGSSLFPSSKPHSNYANVRPLLENTCGELTAKAQRATTLTQPSSPVSGLPHGLLQPYGLLQPHVLAVPLFPGSTCPIKDSTNSILKNTTGFPFTNQCQAAGAEAHVILSTPSMQQPQVLQHPYSCSSDKSILNNPSMNAWSGELSALASMEQLLMSGTGIQESTNGFPSNSENNVPGTSRFPSFYTEPIVAPLYSTGGSLDTVAITGYGGELVDGHHASSSLPSHEREPSSDKFCGGGAPFAQQLPVGGASIQTIVEDFRQANATLAPSNQNLGNDLNQWSSPPHLNTPLNDDLLQALVVDPSPSGLNGGNVFCGIPIRDVPSSVQNPVGFSRNFSATSDEKGGCMNMPGQMSADNDLFDGFGLDLKHRQGQESWEDIMLPTGNINHVNVSSGVSVPVSEPDAASITGPGKGFSEVGLEPLLDAVVSNLKPIPSRSSDDRSSTTTITRAGSASVYSNQVPLAGLPCLSGSMDSLRPDCNSDKTLHGSQKEGLSKSLVSSWIEGSYSINAEGTTVSQSKRPEEPPKSTRKRARPGESTRPRPKDRQQIQDRVKELREIVPNGAKCSIDALLDRTIKHMLFLQSVTKYADKLKQVDEPAMIGKESGVVLKDSSSSSDGQATWAFEVGGQTMVCPIVVEDLNPPGQMLVEMLCEERGFFLEIADIIRGFGLSILKGVMETQENKIWARFVVEANQDVTRMDIFLSLVQLLQQTSSSGTQSSKPIESGVPVFTNYQQSPMPPPISLADKV